MKKVDLFERFKPMLVDLSFEELQKALVIISHFSAMESDTGALVVYLDQSVPLSPHSRGMIHSLNSREPGGFIKNLAKTFKGRSGDEFFKKFFLGYGDDSIADCATLDIFIDGLCMVSANQLQDTPMYSGQETSSRYVEMTSLGYYDPIGTDASQEVFEKLLAFYSKALEKIKPSLYERFPKKEGDKDKDYKNAIHAKACDILGAFLPAGARTNASISMNIRQLRDHYQVLQHNPAKEVSSVTNTILAVLKEVLPDSFDRKPKDEREKVYFDEQDQFLESVAEKTCFMKLLKDGKWPVFDAHFQSSPYYSEMIEEYRELFTNRPRSGARLLPNKVGSIGNVSVRSLLDYRSMRDWHRHRNGIFLTGLLTTRFGFNEWYLNNLTDELRNEAKELLLWLEKHLEQFSSVAEEDLQYLIPMGYLVPQQTHRNLSSEIFVVERRTSLRVHPTARQLAVKTAKFLQETLPEWMTLHVDLSDSEWTVKRGQDVITEVK